MRRCVLVALAAAVGFVAGFAARGCPQPPPPAAHRPQQSEELNRILDNAIEELRRIRCR